MRLRAASYNIHSCVGVDRNRDPERVARVIRELDADVVGLQEVRSDRQGGPEAHQADYLARSLGLEAVSGPAVRKSRGEYGNLLLSRLPILSVAQHDLSVPRWEPRAILEAELGSQDSPVRVVVTHFGLRVSERRRQVRMLVRVLERAPETPTVLLADVNEWLPPSRVLRKLHRVMGRSPARRTFPSRIPLFALDRIWVRPAPALEALAVHRSRLARVASDHLPITATIELPRKS